MEKFISKEYSKNYFYFYFSWGFYFSAGYFCCKKTNRFYPNEICGAI
ncbi:hypothetical protein [Clostridium grantii]|nr:hypothetical protein [Clostridium grantii]